MSVRFLDFGGDQDRHVFYSITTDLAKGVPYCGNYAVFPSPKRILSRSVTYGVV